MNQQVFPSRGARPAEVQVSSPPKAIPATQAALDALPFDSGLWRVVGIPGLYVRCRAATKSFIVQRKVRGRVLKKVLVARTMREARVEAARTWALLHPEPRGAKKTLAEAFEEYVSQRELAPKTRRLYRYVFDHYLVEWKDRTLAEIGADRVSVRTLCSDVLKRHGKATAAQLIRLLSAIYRYARKVDPELPEPPTVVVPMPKIKPRDWAMSPDDLRLWWQAVSGLNPVKRMWWLMCLLTGARAGSIEALEWSDVEFQRKLIRFRVAKGDRPYTVPASDLLIELLGRYREQAPPSQWVFPSPRDPNKHLVDVRDDKRGVRSAHRLRHTFRTVLAELGATPDQARLLMGHSLAGDVSRGYITAPLVMESLRPLANRVAEHYRELLDLDR